MTTNPIEASAVALLLGFGASMALAQSTIGQESAWSARLPKDDKVSYQGAANFDGAGGGAGAMLYPAPGVAGLIAAVLTHAAIVNGVRNSEKSRLQEEADKVLSPYQETLVALTHRALMQRALEKSAAGGSRSLIEASAAGGDAWVVESTPVFLFTQDQRAIVLENTVAIYAPGGLPSAAPAYKNVVRIVSRPQLAEAVPTEWNANQGERLKETSAELLARSFDLAIGDASRPRADNTAPHRTFRYQEGGAERMERAQLVSEGCDRIVIRTLRGWLMSIPAPERAAADPPCGEVASAPTK
ncbi:MAG: hypothetical protein ABJA61_00040 [Caldimonas sp.]